MLQFLKNSCFFGAPLLLLFLGCAVWSWNSVFGAFDPNRIDRATLSRIMQLRDFRRFSSEKQLALTNRCETEFGPRAVQKPVFQFSGSEKKLYAFFQKQHQNRNSGRGGKSGSGVYFETNLSLMARLRYFQWMDAYDTLSDKERRDLLNRIVGDLKYWQTIYFDFLQAADLPQPSIAELIREFDNMIEAFKIGATDKDIARIDSFKQQISASIIAREVQEASDRLGNMKDSISSAVSSVFGTFFGTKKKPESDNGQDDRNSKPRYGTSERSGIQ